MTRKMSFCLPNCPGSAHRRQWSWGLGQIQTHWDTCRPLSLRRINSRILKGKSESTPKVEKVGRVGTLEPGTLEKLVNHLVSAQRQGDPFFVPAFLSTYRRFATTQQVLDLLFLRYRFFHPSSEEDQKNKSALSSLLETWLLQYPADFCQCPDLGSLKQLIVYALINLPDSQIIPQVCRVLTQPGVY
ncbi:ral guanine nucleotide dissociation stimulator-like [Octodon degus]|uniref:Ral guanine nucleotide dissociation stimulator-like n=1 Tax=Octodon degus TaxID=10160 RepID=A0A6P6EH36_OCTDE|nr:ral guanine nucleotide dissociation stimulator-like [Octodon degus]